jgi:hypothetical protein
VARRLLSFEHICCVGVREKEHRVSGRMRPPVPPEFKQIKTFLLSISIIIKLQFI